MLTKIHQNWSKLIEETVEFAKILRASTFSKQSQKSTHPVSLYSCSVHTHSVLCETPTPTLHFYKFVNAFWLPLCALPPPLLLPLLLAPLLVCLRYLYRTGYIILKAFNTSGNRSTTKAQEQEWVTMATNDNNNSCDELPSTRLAPVNTTLPLTKINNTTFGTCIR